MQLNARNLRLTILAAAISMGLAACGGGSSETPAPTPAPTPVPTPDPVVPPETSESLTFVVTGAVVDGISGAVISNVSLTFRENGQVSQNIQDINGVDVDTLQSSDGTFAFTVTEDANVNDLVITAEATDFIDKSSSFDLSDTASDIAISIAMVSNTAEGVAVETQEETIADAMVTQDVVASAGTEESSAEVTVPAGTELQDSEGNPVSGTAVSIEVTVVDTTEDTSGEVDQASVADVIPAGLNDGNTDTIEVPIGVANIEMVDDQGNEIEQFSNPISITISLPNDGIIQAGDVYNLQSYDEDTGVWTDEDSDVTVGTLDSDSNTFPASFEIDHLTFFAVTTNTPACTSDIVANFSGSDVPVTGLFFKAFSEDASLDVYIPGGTSSEVLIPGDRASSLGIASTATARVRVRDVSDFVWFDSSSEVAICGAISAPLSQPNTLVTESISVTATCSNDSTVVTQVSGGLVTYNLIGKTPISADEVGGGGYLLHDMVSGSSYEVTIEPRIDDVNGAVDVQSLTITADGTDETFDFSIQCSSGTGAG